MKRRWVEVRAVGPHKRVHLGVDSDLIEERQVTERPVEFAGQDRPKVDRLLGAVVKLDAKDIRRGDLTYIRMMIPKKRLISGTRLVYSGPGPPPNRHTRASVEALDPGRRINLSRLGAGQPLRNVVDPTTGY